MNERDLFIEALQKTAGAERDDFLKAACGDDAILRKSVEELLAEHQKDASFFIDAPPPGLAAATELTAVTEQPGDTIGPYKLLQQIGEGGMGVVYMAEQSPPVERRVALKIIKPGMDTRQVIARFEAERQALAMMDHPNIAKVLDAGTTDSGRPYFVMELVKGMPVTQYCDEQHLSPRERLELFVPICQAVQHAHQKGIIHRDLKPSNILIAQYDDKPVPKVIDFGVAKAVSHNLTEKTMFTQYGQIVGTIEYMSPEQARFNQLDVDTRSDIYSLGVLLYELLTGETPFDKKRLRSAAFDELLRIIREEEPPRPSTRLSSSETLANTAINRKTEPKKLSLLVRGELDWIVMKALEKDRNRRYETANGFGADVQRYLNDEQVLACPPSGGYRLRKFVRRNKGRLVTTSLLATALLVAVGGVGWALRDRAAQRAEIENEREAREAEIAREQEQRLIRTQTQVELILADVDRLMQEQNWDEALSTIRRAEAVVTSGESDAAIEARVHALLHDLEFIDRLEQIRLERATWVEGNFNYAGADLDYARAFRDYGVDVETLAAETSIERLKGRPAFAILWAAALDEWFKARWISKKEGASRERFVAVARGIDPDPLRDRLRSTWPVTTSEVGDELLRMADSIDIRVQHPATVVSLARSLHRAKFSDSALRILRDAHYFYPGDFWLNFTLGSVLSDQKDPEGAARFYTAAVSIRPHSYAAYVNLGNALRNQKKLDEAIAATRKAIELEPTYAIAHANLGNALRDQKKLDEAIDCFRRAIELDPKYVVAHSNLGVTLRAQKKLDEAIDCFRKAIELDPKLAEAHNNLGFALRAQEKLDEAIDCYRRAIELDPKYAVAHSNLGVALRTQKKLDEAIDCFCKAIQLEPEYAGTYIHLGALLCDNLNDYDQAIDCFRKAIQLDPTKANAYDCLCVALQKKSWDLINNPEPKRRDPEEAIHAIKEAIELAPQSALNWQYLGWVRYRIGNWIASIEALEKSCMLQGGRGDSGQWIVLALAHARLASEDGLPEKECEYHRTEARRWFEQADGLINRWLRTRPSEAVAQGIWDFCVEARELMIATEKKE